jgi:hypothetical protein
LADPAAKGTENVCKRAQTNALVVRLLGKTPGKIAIVAALTDDPRVEIGPGFEPSQFLQSPYSGDDVPTGMGGRGTSLVDAGGSGRSRSGIRLRAENTPLSWSAVDGCCGALISSGGSALGDRGSTATTGRDRMSTGGTGSGRTSRAPGWRLAPVAGLISTGCG